MQKSLYIYKVLYKILSLIVMSHAFQYFW